MLLETEGARAVTYFAAYAADSEPDELSLASSAAKAYASDAGWRVAANASRCTAASASPGSTTALLPEAGEDGRHLFGTAREHRDRVAELLQLSA